MCCQYISQLKHLCSKRYLASCSKYFQRFSKMPTFDQNDGHFVCYQRKRGSGIKRSIYIFFTQQTPVHYGCNNVQQLFIITIFNLLSTQYASKKAGPWKSQAICFYKHTPKFVSLDNKVTV